MSPLLPRESCARAAALITAVIALVPVVGRAQADPPKALINDATVTGGAVSQEAAIASSLGFEVTVVSDATWGSYTADDFGQYDLLIAGDPSCGSLPPGLIASAPVFGPVVLGFAGGRTLAGNRVVVGSDPVFHDLGDYTSPGAKGTVVREGIAFAGDEPGRTGMYFDATCATHPEPGQAADILSILESLSEGAGSWTIEDAPPCGSAVSLIASHPAFSDLSTASLQGWNCSVHESFPTFPADWSALAVATDTSTRPVCGIDPHTGLNACGQAYILIAGSGIVVRSAQIAVSPTEATNPVDTDHTVTAHVTMGVSAPLVGQAVTFSVTGQNSGATGTCVPAGCVTDDSGDVSFTYHDSNGPGDDTIKASFTDAFGSLQSATAQKHWQEEVLDDDLAIGSAPDLTVPALSKRGVVVTYAAPEATDPDDVEPPVVTCTPPSGSLFPVGTTTVTCTATSPDDTPSEVSTSFTVTVTPPPPRSSCGRNPGSGGDQHHGKKKAPRYGKPDRHQGSPSHGDDARSHDKGSWWDRALRFCGLRH
jgi:hypothetical protein